MEAKPSVIPLILPEDELTCSICQDLMEAPVTIPCGHNFCMECIKTNWSKSYSDFYCPHCRRKFLKKPDLYCNTVLCSLMEHVAKVWVNRDASRESDPVDKAQVDCDICEEDRKLPAEKTCVTCLASFCSVHLKPHLESQALMRHGLCSPVGDTTDLQCGKHHGKLLEFFCKTHQASICGQCLTKHRKCRTTTVEEMKTEWMAEIETMQEAAEKMVSSINEATDTLTVLKEGVKSAAEKMKDDLDQCFQALRDTIEQAQDRAKTFVETEEQEVLQQIEKLDEELGEDMWSEVHTVMGHLELCRNDDSYFNFRKPLMPLPQQEVGQLHCSNFQLNGHAVEKMTSDLHLLRGSLESQLQTVLQRREKLQDNDFVMDDFKVIRGHRKQRSKLMKYACGVTFDPATASASVLLTEDSLAVSVAHGGLLAWKDYWVDSEMGFRVLCSQSFTRGQHYWEVSPPEGRDGNWAIGVTYRRGEDRYRTLGRDQSSWCVRWQRALVGEEEEEEGKRAAGKMKKGNVDSKKVKAKMHIKKGEKAQELQLRDLRKERKTCLAGAREGHPEPVQETSEAGELRKERKTCLAGAREGHPEPVQETSAAEAEEEPEMEAGEEEEGATNSTPEDSPGPGKAITGFFASHDAVMHLLSQEHPGKIGVYLDCDRGCVSFFSVSGARVRLCYRFETLLSEPLHPAVWLREPEKTMTIS